MKWEKKKYSQYQKEIHCPKSITVKKYMLTNFTLTIESITS